METWRRYLVENRGMVGFGIVALILFVVAPWPTVIVLLIATASLWLYRWRAARRPSQTSGERAWRIVTSALMVVGFTFSAIQFVPYGRSQENPPVVAEPQWDSERTRELAQRACFDCHSNETVWPWYATYAPVSWMITAEVEEGRDVLNFSEFDRPWPTAGKAASTVEDGSMPPASYRWMHDEAQLTSDERAELAAGLRATFG
jgi:mono/diheme cytochrome c family protein